MAKGYIYLSQSNRVKRKEPSSIGKERTIKGRKFQRKTIFHMTKSSAKESQKAFKKRGHYTRILPASEKIGKRKQHGYYLFTSKK